MIKKLYTVYDKKAEATCGIFEQPNDLVAIRDFSQTCNYVNKEGEKTQIAKYPDDYCLMRLGELDTNTGIIQPNVQTIAEAKEYVTE